MYEILYYNRKLRDWIDKLPRGIRASYKRITDIEGARAKSSPALRQAA